MVTTDLLTFMVVSIPVMIVLGLRHALDIDHITAIDNLLRLYNTKRNSRWVGSGFSFGHMIAVVLEMILIVIIIGSITKVEQISLWGGIIGTIALGTIGTINVYSMKKCGKTGSAILANKISKKTIFWGPVGSSFFAGLIFGLGFDTATQISAIILSTVVTATSGIQVALILTGFFAIGMVSLDTLDSIILRSVFHKLVDTKGFRYMSYALSIVAIAVSLIVSFETLAGLNIIPEITGPLLAITIIITSFGYSFYKKGRTEKTLINKNKNKNKNNKNICIKSFELKKVLSVFYPKLK
jgi:high-affinity nickel-transport protein